ARGKSLRHRRRRGPGTATRRSMSIRITTLAAAVAFVLASPASAQSGDGVVAMYRCPGNDYNNTITAAEAEKLRCKKVENAPVTLVQSSHVCASARSG